jgi:hypothetical protein
MKLLPRHWRGPAGESGRGEGGDLSSDDAVGQKRAALAKKEKPARWPAYKSELNS